MTRSGSASNRWPRSSSSAASPRTASTRTPASSYGITIGAEFQGRGYASEAIILLLRYMFGERRFQKCDVGIYAYNTASLKLHTKLGFVEEGRRRRSQFFAGEYHDVVLMGITIEEYAAAHSLGSVGSC